MSINYSNDDMTNLAHRWCDAGKQKLGTSDKIDLYNDTNNVIKYLQQTNPELQGKIHELAEALIVGLKDSPFTDLAEWIASNSSYSSKIENSGAYKTLNDLITTVKNIEKNADLNKISEVATNSLTKIKEKKAPLHRDIKPVVYGYFDLKDLNTIKSTSKTDSAIKPENVIFIDRINRGEITLEDFRICIEKQFNVKECSQITRLDLRDFEVTDADIKMIADLLPNVKHLFINYKNKLSTESSPHFAKMTLLQSLILQGCTKFPDINFLENCKLLEHLDLSYSNGLKDASGCQHLINLKSLNLTRARNLKNFDFLEKLLQLQSFDISYTQFADITKLSHCLELITLNLDHTRLEQTFQHGEWEWDDDKDNWKEFSKKFPSFVKLENLSLNGARMIDFSFLNKLSALITLDLTNTPTCYLKEEDFSVFKHLEKVTLAKSNITTLECFKNCKCIKNINLSHCRYLSSLIGLPESIEIIDYSFNHGFDFKELDQYHLLKKINLIDCDFYNISILENIKSLDIIIKDSFRIDLLQPLQEKGIITLSK